MFYFTSLEKLVPFSDILSQLFSNNHPNLTEKQVHLHLYSPLRDGNRK